MNILITGTSGLVGGEVNKLLNGHSISHEVLRHPSCIDLRGYDTVIHCSAYGNHRFQTDVNEMIQANIINTYNLLEASKKDKIKTFILIGTSSEYGIKNKPMREDSPCHPQGFYAITKHCASLLALEYKKYFNVVVIRPFSIYGENEADHRLIPTIIDSIKTGRKIEIVNAFHDWIHVSDVANLIKKVIEKPFSGILNCGTGIQTDNVEIVGLLQNISGKKVNMIRHDVPLSNWVADTTKMFRIYKPKIDLVTGLKKFYDFKKKNF